MTKAKEPELPSGVDKSCLACGGTEEYEFCALLPLMATVQGSDQQIVAKLPHEYYVGRNCYFEQFAKVYPNEPLPEV